MVFTNLALIPPLRIVVTKECNGICSFCHSEGYKNDERFISLNAIDQCISGARELNLPLIALTGGEPTLHANIYDIIKQIKTQLPCVELAITTTGVDIVKLIEICGDKIDKINVSVSSLKEEVYMKSTRVNPFNVFNTLKGFSGKKATNIVVTNDNASEIETLLEHCFERNISVDLMPILNFSDSDYVLDIIKKMTKKYDFKSLTISSTPTLYKEIANGTTFRIKHPSFSKLVNREACRDCEHNNECDERMSAVRVFPDGTVTPCINGKLSKNSGIHNIKNNIVEIYNTYISTDIYNLLMS